MLLAAPWVARDPVFMPPVHQSILAYIYDEYSRDELTRVAASSTTDFVAKANELSDIRTQHYGALLSESLRNQSNPLTSLQTSVAVEEAFVKNVFDIELSKTSRSEELIHDQEMRVCYGHVYHDLLESASSSAGQLTRA